MLLVLGYFTCGFQLAFITVHLPSYLVDRGLSAQVGGWTLATIGLFNIVGSITSGWLGDRMPKRYLLSLIYFGRAAAIFGFIIVSGHGVTVPRVRRGHGPVVAVDGTARPTASSRVMFGTRWLATLAGFAFFSHQVGGFLGVWLGGIVFDRIRLVRSGVVARDPVRRALGAHQSADRREAGSARGRRAGLIGRSMWQHSRQSSSTRPRAARRCGSPISTTRI